MSEEPILFARLEQQHISIPPIAVTSRIFTTRPGGYIIVQRF